MPRFVLRTRVVLVTLLVLVVVAITASGLWIVRNRLRRQNVARLSEDLEHSAQTFANLQAQRNLELERENALLANLPSLKALMTTSHRATIADAGVEFSQLSGADLFALIDNTGIVQVAYAHGIRNQQLEDDLAPATRNAANHYLRSGDQLFYYSIQPLYFGDQATGTLLGYVINGYSIDREFVRQVSQAASADAAFFVRGEILATTFPGERKQNLATAFSTFSLANNTPQRLLVEDEPYLAQSSTLENSGPDSVRLLLLKSFRPLELQIRETDRLFIVVGILAVIAGTVLMLVISDRITRPLEKLAQSMRAFGAGDCSSPLPQRGTLELRELSANFAAMREKIQQTNHALLESERLATIGRMASSVSHDLRHYLAAVYANAEFLALASISSKERAELFEDIKLAVHGTTDLIESLLIFGRTGAGIQRIRTLLSNVVSRAVMLIEKHPDAASAKIEFVCADPLASAALLDPRQMERAVYNLLLNACQSGATQVSATISTTDPTSLHVIVRDNGPGVPEKIRTSLRDPFVSEGKQKGTGLGLTLAHCVAQEHGGSVELLSSRPGETIFVLSVARSLSGQDAVSIADGELETLL